MTTEYAGITIIIDQGPNRTIINIPKAEDVETIATERPVYIRPNNLSHALSLRFQHVPLPNPFIAFGFRPIGEYTMRKEPNPMHTPAPSLSEHDQAEVERFGIHTEDPSTEGDD